MSVDSNGSIYILDGDNGRVLKWMQGSSSGILAAGGSGLGNNTNQIDSAAGMFIDSNTSAIWIADTHNHRIVRWTSPTTSAIVCGSYGSNADQFRFPGGVFVDASDSNALYVADTANHRIQLWVSGATSGRTVGGITGIYGDGLDQLYYPVSVIGDGNGNIYVADFGNNRIIRWVVGSSSGLTISGSLMYGVLPSQLNNPTSVKLDSSGALIVADTANSRIQKFSISCGKY